MNVVYRRSTAEELPQIESFWQDHWGDGFMVLHGVVYRPGMLEGFIAEENGEWVGLATYTCQGNECEIVSLDGLREGKGIGTRLIDCVVEEARRCGCQRVFLITTNDNLEALGLYQKRGFELVAVHRAAINAARLIKPAISLIGLHGIPLRDEIELEMRLL